MAWSLTRPAKSAPYYIRGRRVAARATGRLHERDNYYEQFDQRVVAGLAATVVLSVIMLANGMMAPVVTMHVACSLRRGARLTDCRVAGRLAKSMGECEENQQAVELPLREGHLQ